MLQSPDSDVSRLILELTLLTTNCIDLSTLRIWICQASTVCPAHELPLKRCLLLKTFTMFSIWSFNTPGNPVGLKAHHPSSIPPTPAHLPRLIQGLWRALYCRGWNPCWFQPELLGIERDPEKHSAPVCLRTEGRRRKACETPA